MLLVVVVLASVVFANGGSGASSSGASAPSGATAPGDPTGSTPGQPFGSPTGSTPGQPFGSPTGATPGRPFGSPTGPIPGASMPSATGAVPGGPTVGPPLDPAFDAAPSRRGRHVASRLRRRLFSDPDLAKFDLQIVPFAGRFVIQGNVDTQQEKDLITQRAAAVAGNGNVDNEVTVGLFAPQAEPNGPPPGVNPASVGPNGTLPSQDMGGPDGHFPEPGNRAPPDFKGTIGGAATRGESADRALAGRVRRAVFTDSRLSGVAGDVHVFASNGKVVLQGRVRSEQDKSSIEKKAGAIAGSDNVDDRLSVFP